MVLMLSGAQLVLVMGMLSLGGIEMHVFLGIFKN